MDSYENWNLKQSFLYLEASFDGDNGRNIQVIWDKILPRKDIQKNKGKLSYNNL